MKSCDWCGSEFEASVSYQIYCCPDCREQATRAKISARNSQKRRQRLASRTRQCAQCQTTLSVYNTDNLCGACVINQRQVDKALKELKGIIDYERFDR